MSKTLAFIFIILGIFFIGLSAFQGLSLQGMIGDEALFRSTDYLSSIRNGTTMPVGPQDRFLGKGLVGAFAPTLLAICGTLCIVSAWRGLEAKPHTHATSH